ncbi:hypothetical protein GIV77_21870 [Pseudomonas sp. PA-3-6E]|nr:hypothetical protein [Pseudomonas sp. PA-3-6E]
MSLDNLINMIITCIDHPSAANQVFLVSDGEDLSTTQLLVRISKALNKPSRLIPVPSRILELFAGLLGKRDFSRRLCGSLQVDIAKNRELLNWTPQVSVDQALSKTVNFFLEQDK